MRSILIPLLLALATPAFAIRNAINASIEPPLERIERRTKNPADGGAARSLLWPAPSQASRARAATVQHQLGDFSRAQSIRRCGLLAQWHRPKSLDIRALERPG
jgi:hypothetical protein